MIYVSIAILSGIIGGIIARTKGNNVVVWFLVAGAVPVIGTVAALLIRSERDDLRRQCPACGRVVALHDQLCRCGEELYFPDEAVESRAAAEQRAAADRRAATA